MNNIKNRIYLIGLVFPLLFISCKKDFLEKPPTDAIVDAGFYKTDEQVLAATSLLYSRVWFDYNDKASYNLVISVPAHPFPPGTTAVMYCLIQPATIWKTRRHGVLFYVVGQSNLAIVNINRYGGEGVSANVKKIAIAEARFMRALAYRFLVMNWGEVPIIENNIELLSDTSLSKNTVPSVWRFITREMRAVADDLPETPLQVGRVTKWSAEGMLARFYLTRAGVEGNGSTRNQTFLDSAKYYAQRVINSSGRSLLRNYEDLFKYPYDNNSESLFELQWVFSSGTWGDGNSAPASLAYSGDIANGDGWGGDKGATWWMMQQYEGFEEQADGTLKGRTLDQRLKATFMLPGAEYPEITQMANNVKQDLVYPFTGTDANFLAIKKYVIGKAEDVNGEAASQRYPNNTYMMRLAETYLIYAEAALGNNPSTTDATAFEYFNKVHTRAGLPPITSTDPVSGAATPLTSDMIFSERIKEFAIEAMAWYDLVSLHYYNPEKAYSILNSQDRGLFFTAPDKMPNPNSWTFTKTSWFAERDITANAGNFRLPIPNSDLSQAPNLMKPAVDYP